MRGICKERNKTISFLYPCKLRLQYTWFQLFPGSEAGLERGNEIWAHILERAVALAQSQQKRGMQVGQENGEWWVTHVIIIGCFFQVLLMVSHSFLSYKCGRTSGVGPSLFFYPEGRSFTSP